MIRELITKYIWSTVPKHYLYREYNSRILLNTFRFPLAQRTVGLHELECLVTPIFSAFPTKR